MTQEKTFEEMFPSLVSLFAVIIISGCSNESGEIESDRNYLEYADLLKKVNTNGVYEDMANGSIFMKPIFCIYDNNTLRRVCIPYLVLMKDEYTIKEANLSLEARPLLNISC